MESNVIFINNNIIILIILIMKMIIKYNKKIYSTPPTKDIDELFPNKDYPVGVRQEYGPK